MVSLWVMFTRTTIASATSLADKNMDKNMKPLHSETWVGYLGTIAKWLAVPRDLPGISPIFPPGHKPVPRDGALCGGVQG